MPAEYTVIGEHRDDESQLLVMGTDGRYYSYAPARELIAPTDPDEFWVISDSETPERPDGDMIDPVAP